MKKIDNFDQVPEPSTGLKPGGYIVQILGVDDDPKKECLKLSYDIVEGPFKDYYRELYKQFNFWGGNFWRSYKETALSMFKGFIVSVEKSNKGFTWNWDEQALKGLKLGVVMGEEEYIPKGGYHAGEVRTKLVVSKVVEIEKIKNGDFKVPELKKLKESEKQKAQKDDGINLSIDSDDLPF